MTGKISREATEFAKSLLIMSGHNYSLEVLARATQKMIDKSMLCKASGGRLYVDGERFTVKEFVESAE